MPVKLPVKNSSDVYEVNPQKIIALGLNYQAHIQESLSLKVKSLQPEVPTEPVLFAKTPNVLIGPGEPIVIPAFLKKYDFNEIRTDYEAELAFIINQRCKNVPLESF